VTYKEELKFTQSQSEMVFQLPLETSTPIPLFTFSMLVEIAKGLI